MNNYKTLAIRYLKMNKKRSLITIFGVVITTTILFTILNFGLCLLLAQREKVREDEDYEIVLMTRTEEQIHQVLADDRVKSAYVGPYYWYSIRHEELYPMALYINTSNPYRMNAIFDELQNTYGLEGRMHSELAWTYMQGYQGNLATILILTVLLVSFVFAIFGVGIVRNSIQLCTLENIRDYGNMRCIGASKKQLKRIIYLQGVILEVIGILIGCLLGTLPTVILGWVLKVPAGFHILPVIAILVVFLGDLYFVMSENNKLIMGMTPLSAIRGEYRIHKEKIKLRDKNLFGKLLGVEGDYAYKSIMRNPGRFFRTVSAMVFGIGAFIAIAGILNSITWIAKEEESHYQYFQLYYESAFDISMSIEQVQSSLPSASQLAKLTELDCITEAKRIYSYEIWLADLDSYYEKSTQDAHIYELYKEAEADAGNDEMSDRRMKNLSQIVAGIYCYGYDDMDFQRYQSALEEGTLDVSENGIVIVNSGEVVDYEAESLGTEYIYTTFSDYKVGDTIDLVNMQRFRSETAGQLETLERNFREEQQQIEEEYRGSDDLEERMDNCYSNYYQNKNAIIFDCWQKLIQEGDYTTYTIEGILNEDVNHYSMFTEGHLTVILPLERYFALTGTDETMNTGMQYHVDKYPNNKKLYNICEEITGDVYVDISTDKIVFGNVDYESYATGYMTSAYPYFMEELKSIRNKVWYAVLLVVFVVSMATLNIINATASNLHLRRKEFAQLRVIGISKKRLMKMVLLEGVITTVVADLLGILVGTVLSADLYHYLTIMFGVSYRFPFAAALIGILASVLILCGSIYVPLKGLKQDMASDLSAGGD